MSTNAKVNIRAATEDDIPLVLSFIRELGEYERELERVVATEDVLRAALFGRHPYASAVILSVEQAPAAFAIYFFSFSSFSSKPSLYLEDIFVRPSFRGRGLGKELMTFLARVAQEHGCGRMEWSVLNWNESAIQFYRRLGANPVTDWTVFHLASEDFTRLANGG